MDKKKKSEWQDAERNRTAITFDNASNA
jgi:hypothetical protein